LIFGLLLGWYDRGADQNTREEKELTWRQTLVVGIAQTFALIPGTSRSGVTMTALIALGFTRKSAARFSFLMALPAIALPGLLKGAELATAAHSINWGTLITGVAVSALMAFLCMHWFIRFIERVGMMPFVIYRVLLAIVIVVIIL